jgi:hypothetical protein
MDRLARETLSQTDAIPRARGLSPGPEAGPGRGRRRRP